MKNVVIRAPLLSISGYGEHSRQIFKFLLTQEDISLKTQVVQWGNTSWYINPDELDGLVGKIMNVSTSSQDGFDVSIQVQLPDEWSSTLAKFNVGVTAGVETDICSQAWIDAINKMDLVIVPSNHVKNTFLKSGVLTTPIKVIGEWYQEELDLEPLESVTNLKFDTSFNFLVVSQLTSLSNESDRKNIINTLKWFCETFQNDKDVGLILKTNIGRGTEIDRLNVYATISKAVSLFRKTQFPKIHVVHGAMSSHEIASLYRHPTVKCFINLTRGEGFGIPILDATVAKLPVVTTNWSGHLDFMNLGKFIAVDYNLIELPKEKIDNRIFVPNAKWADPSESDFKKRITKFRSSYLVPKEWSTALSEKCKEKFSRNAIEKDYSSCFRDILR